MLSAEETIHEAQETLHEKLIELLELKNEKKAIMIFLAENMRDVQVEINSLDEKIIDVKNKLKFISEGV